MKASKEAYRTYFAQCRRYVKMNKVFEDMDMDPTNFYRFMKGVQFNYTMSVELLESIEKSLIKALNEIT